MTAASSHTPTAILGAGLTGMSAALTLSEAGAPHRIFEKLERPGGHAVTIEDAGYRFDRTGHLLHTRTPEMRALVERLLPDELLGIERHSVVWSNGVYTRYPFQANTFGLPPRVAYECVLGFVEAWEKRHTAPPPRNFEEYCLTHFGRGISEHFMLPYNARLWGVPAREITSSWCERFVPRPTLEDVLSGAVGHQSRELGYNAEFVYPRRGIGELSAALHRALPHIELGCEPKAIDASKREIDFGAERVGYGRLISTLPLPVLVGLLSDAPEQVRAAAGRLRATHLYYLDVALNAPAGKPYHWVYVPEARYPFYRVGCYSNFSSAMAPPGKAGLYVELSARTEPDLAALLPEVGACLLEMGFISEKSAIRFARVRRLDYAYVIFDHAYDEAVRAIAPYLDEAGILSTGRYGGWNYSSMEDALLFGRDAARRVLGSAAGALG